ncbi:hypothetical protein J4732_14715 [Serratia marcescens]|uniref:Uncharacterized protein n=1 Tax=Serratia marcescens TaxID=615 RepID=A0A939NMC9_SERMA|nr:hypothetical protein [Serratia marcescens]
MQGPGARRSRAGLRWFGSRLFSTQDCRCERKGHGFLLLVEDREHHALTGADTSRRVEHEKHPRRGDAPSQWSVQKRTGSVNAANRVAALEDQGCPRAGADDRQRHTGRMKARRHSVADQTEPNAVQFGPSAGKSSDAFRSPDKGAEASQGFGWRESIHLWASRPRPSSKPFAASAISQPVSWLGPEIWRASHTRSPLFRQRAPAPATIDRKRSPRRLAVLHTKASGETARISAGTSIREPRRNAIRGEMTFSPSRP